MFLKGKAVPERQTYTGLTPKKQGNGGHRCPVVIVMVGWSGTFMCLTYSYCFLLRGPYTELMMAVSECKVETVLCQRRSGKNP